MANGTVKPFDGDVADYGRFVLGQGAPAPKKKLGAPVKAAPASNRKRDQSPLKRELAALEAKMSRFQDLLRRVDQALRRPAPRAATPSRWRTSPPAAATSNGRSPPPKRRGLNCRNRPGGRDRQAALALANFDSETRLSKGMRRLFRFGVRPAAATGGPVSRELRAPIQSSQGVAAGYPGNRNGLPPVARQRHALKQQRRRPAIGRRRVNFDLKNTLSPDTGNVK